ncbi:helix-turn-helix domain-containing protein [Roseateles puraquae]|jgi:transcriptional regulator with XRE-family HTH domain|uniref:helix-turn-helix domain-containing protein n=1 Tax=Roseateles puraquae TaxID=431059 RepID=UPI0018735613|nr:helix-turn-helix domain-containing protein [Roseateles puraquae]
MVQSLIPDSNARQIGRSLRLWRSLRRLKQSAAADLLKVSQATVSRWEAGTATPSPLDQQALRVLMSARLDSAADFALARLVRRSSEPMHLVCDVTHRLLALSPARERRCRLPGAELLGQGLWRYATPQIVEQEGQLDRLGWFEPAPAAIEFDTQASLNQDMPIDRGRMRWVRLQLSDGSYVRLTDTVPPSDGAP